MGQMLAFGSFTCCHTDWCWCTHNCSWAASGGQDQTGNISIYSPSEKGLSHAKTALCSLSGMRLCIIFLQSDRDQATIDHIKGQNGHTRLDRVNTNTSPAHIRHIRVDTSFLAGTLPSSVKMTLTQVRQTGAQTWAKTQNKTRFDPTAGWFKDVAPDPHYGRNKEKNWLCHWKDNEIYFLHCPPLHCISEGQTRLNISVVVVRLYVCY